MTDIRTSLPSSSMKLFKNISNRDEESESELRVGIEKCRKIKALELELGFRDEKDRKQKLELK